MSAIQRWLDRFCYKHPRFGIPNLMLVIVVGNVLVWLMDQFSYGVSLSALLAFSPYYILHGQIWRIITFVFVPLDSNLFFLAVSLYFYYMIGSVLEREWGTAKFNVFYGLGILLNVVVGFLLYVVTAPLYPSHLLPLLTTASMTYVNLSLFFAFATLYPNMQVLLFFMLNAHYRSPLNFSAELMEASKNGLERILNATDNLKHLIASVAAEEMSAEEKEAFSKTDAYVEEFEKAMDDDFNTADAIAAIFELVKYANTTATAESSKEYLRGLLDRIVKLGDVLGLILDKKEELLDADIEKLIEERQAARKAKDFTRADAIRDELLEKGIVLKDTREGVQWKRA